MNRPGKRKRAVHAALGLLSVILMLSGCGGSAGTEADSSGPTVNGIASAGFTLIGQASIKDSSLPAREKTTIIGSDGSFTFDVSGMQGPFILQAMGSAAGTVYVLNSFADRTGIANINPLSNVAVASAAGVDDPALLYANPDQAVLQQIESRLAGTIANIQSALTPLLAHYGAVGIDPIKDLYVANHTGLDALFDDVKFSLSQGSLTISSAASGAVIFASSVNNILGGQFADMSLITAIPTALPVLSAANSALLPGSVNGTVGGQVANTSSIVQNPANSLTVTASGMVVVPNTDTAGAQSANTPAPAAVTATTPANPLTVTVSGTVIVPNIDTPGAQIATAPTTAAATAIAPANPLTVTASGMVIVPGVNDAGPP